MTSRYGWLERALPLLLFASVASWIVAWHLEAFFRMAGVWWRSDTYAHGLIVYPVSIWLIWRQRALLRTLPLAPCFWALVPIGLAAFVALLGDLGGVEAARQFGPVAMLPLAAVAILGTSITRAIAFPLAFTLLAIPVGDFMLPLLMQHTADFTVAALRATGIPVYREGLYFTVPSGRWSVVEACSGLRYLIASATLGLLYAYLSYRSTWRRVLFVLASIAVPIVANWVRAYMIVMIGHLSGMRYAVGVDHLIYGWIFFGVVMLLLFWLGSWWREDLRSEPDAPPQTPHAPMRLTAPILLAALAVAALAAAGPSYTEMLDARSATADPAVRTPAAAGGWVPAASRLPHFRPHYIKARSSVQQVFERDGRQVGGFIAYYARQWERGELIAFGNDLVSTLDRGWGRTGEQRVSTGAGVAAVIESRLRSERTQLMTWHWYWAGGQWSARPEEVKLRQAFDRLTGRGDDAAVVVLYTEPGASIHDDSASLLRRFAHDMEPALRAALEGARASAAQRAAVVAER